MTDAEIYALADQHGTRFRTADEEGMTFDKHALLDFARALTAGAPVAEVVAGNENLAAVKFTGPIPPKGTKLYVADGVAGRDQQPGGGQT